MAEMVLKPCELQVSQGTSKLTQLGQFPKVSTDRACPVGSLGIVERQPRSKSGFAFPGNS